MPLLFLNMGLFWPPPHLLNPRWFAGGRWQSKKEQTQVWRALDATCRSRICFDSVDIERTCASAFVRVMHFNLLPSHGNHDYQQMDLQGPTLTNNLQMHSPTVTIRHLPLDSNRFPADVILKSISDSLAAGSWPTMGSMEEEERVEAPHPSHLPSDLWPSWPRGVDKCWMSCRWHEFQQFLNTSPKHVRVKGKQSPSHVCWIYELSKPHIPVRCAKSFGSSWRRANDCSGSLQAVLSGWPGWCG